MNDAMSFPATVEEFMEQYKIVDCDHVYSNGMEMVPIFRMKQWFEHEANHNAEVSKMEIIRCKNCKRFRKPSSIVNADWGWCSGWPTPLTTSVKVDGFCHRAERRDEA